MSDTPKHIQEAFEHLDALCTFAYRNGFHEIGYDPVHLLRNEVAKLREALEDATGICYSPCEKHMGMSFTMTVGPAPTMKTVCPICEPTERKTSREIPSEEGGV